MNCYEAIVKIAQNGHDKIYINLCNKTIKVGKQAVIENGQVRQYKIITDGGTYEFENLIEQELNLDELYAQYKTSLPSERDSGRHYFKALSVNELTDAQMVQGMHRFEARVRLEAYVLLASMCGLLTWPDESKWFWQGVDNDFIILKSYI